MKNVLTLFGFFVFLGFGRLLGETLKLRDGLGYK